MSLSTIIKLLNYYFMQLSQICWRLQCCHGNFVMGNNNFIFIINIIWIYKVQQVQLGKMDKSKDILWIYSSGSDSKNKGISNINVLPSMFFLLRILGLFFSSMFLLFVLSGHGLSSCICESMNLWNIGKLLISTKKGRYPGSVLFFFLFLMCKVSWLKTIGNTVNQVTNLYTSILINLKK